MSIETSDLGLGMVCCLTTAGGLAALTGALVVANRYATKRLWPATSNELMGYTPGTEEVIMTFPGLGASFGDLKADDVRAVIADVESVYWQYSTQGTSVLALAHILGSAAGKDLGRVHVNGDSMGGPLGLEVIRKSEISAKLGHVILHCSPFGIEDAVASRGWRVARYLSWANGPFAKGAGSMIKGLVEGKGLVASAKQARNDSVRGSSPALWLSMVRVLEDIRLDPLAYRGLVDDATRFTYCMPDDAARDSVVNTMQASQRYADFCGQLDVPFELVKIPSVGHADVKNNCVYLAGM